MLKGTPKNQAEEEKKKPLIEFGLDDKATNRPTSFKDTNRPESFSSYFVNDLSVVLTSVQKDSLETVVAAAEGLSPVLPVNHILTGGTGDDILRGQAGQNTLTGRGGHRYFLARQYRRYNHHHYGFESVRKTGFFDEFVV
jgi:hypothetical protein